MVSRAKEAFVFDFTSFGKVEVLEVVDDADVDESGVVLGEKAVARRSELGYSAGVESFDDQQKGIIHQVVLTQEC